MSMYTQKEYTTMRFEAAKAAMQGIMAKENSRAHTPEYIIDTSIKYADMLLTALGITAPEPPKKEMD